MTRRMPPRTEYFYRQFIANLRGPFAFHPCDMRRFYEFIWVAHLGRSSLTGAELRGRLIDDGVTIQDAETLSDIYDQCRTFAESRIDPNYVDWRRTTGAGRESREAES